MRCMVLPFVMICVSEVLALRCWLAAGQACAPRDTVHTASDKLTAY